MEALNGNADDSPLIYTEEGSLLTPEQQEEEAQVPPVSSCCGIVKIFCCVKYRFPVLVALANVIGLGFGHAILSGYMEFIMYRNGPFKPTTDEEEQKKQEDMFMHQMSLVLTTGFAVLTVIYVLDSYLFLRSARRLEQKVALQQEDNEDLTLNEESEEQGTARPSGRIPSSPTRAGTTSSSPTGIGSDDPNQQHKVDYVKVSKSVDAAFGCNSDSSSATFLVALLYALFAIATWKSVGSATKLAYLGLSNSSKISYTAGCLIVGPFQHDYESEQKQEEYGIASLQKSEQFFDLPTEIQAWIKSQKDKERHGPLVFNRSQPYLRTEDGSLVFDFQKKPPKDEKDMAWRYRGEVPGLAVWNSNNDSITEFMATAGDDYWGYDSKLQLIGFPEQPPYTGWCGLFKMGSLSVLQDEVICAHTTGGNKSEIMRFPPVNDDIDNWGGSSGDYSMYATDDTLWVATQKEVDRDMGRRNGRSRNQEVLISLVSYNVLTFEKRLAADRNITKRAEDNYDRRHRTVNKNCRKGYRWGLATSVLSLAAISYYLYRLDVPSCVFPLSLAMAVVSNAIFIKGPWASAWMLAMAFACLYMLSSKRGDGSAIWKFVSLEMMIWALYSFILGAGWGYLQKVSDYDFIADIFWDGRWQDCLLLPFTGFLAALVITVLLDHPIFQILSYLLGGLAALSSFSAFMGLRFLIFPVVIMTMSLGCFQSGKMFQQYRVHVIVYCRRLGRCIRARCCCCFGRSTTTRPGII